MAYITHTYCLYIFFHMNMPFFRMALNRMRKCNDDIWRNLHDFHVIIQQHDMTLTHDTYIQYIELNITLPLHEIW